MALSNSHTTTLSPDESKKYVLGLPIEFLEQFGIRFTITVWRSLLHHVPGTSLAPYRPILIRDLVAMKTSTLVRLPGISKKTVEKLDSALRQLHLKFDMSEEADNIMPLPTPEERLAATERHELVPPRVYTPGPNLPVRHPVTDNEQVIVEITQPSESTPRITNLTEAQDLRVIHWVTVKVASVL